MAFKNTEEENITTYRKKDRKTEDIETEEDLQTRVITELETNKSINTSKFNKINKDTKSHKKCTQT